MHSPWSQNPSLHSLKHSPQCWLSLITSTQTLPHISSPGPVQSPPVVVCMVSLSVSPDVPVVSSVDESLSDELEVDDESEVDDSVVEVEVDVEVDDESEVDDDDEDDEDDDESEVAAADDVESEAESVGFVVTSLVLDIESVPADDSSLVDPPVVSSPGSPQANRVRPTSAEITNGADPWT
jgi:hypothetical protein